MNYAYPLFSESDEAKIAKICKQTACTVVYNLPENRYYLALTGCGMNLSQSIALAYIIADGCIEWDMIGEVDISGAFSVSEEDYQIILKQMEQQLKVCTDNYIGKLQKVREQLKNEFGARSRKKIRLRFQGEPGFLSSRVEESTHFNISLTIKHENQTIYSP